jgi:nucleoside-diphosphate-sugar epimerase
MRVLIIGCGYVGRRLGARLIARGDEVYGARRSQEGARELEAHGIQPILADITHPESLKSLPRSFDWIVNVLSSSHGGVEEYRKIYLEGTRRIIEWLVAEPPAKFVYTSSTSVYGQMDGSWVDEKSPAIPSSPTGRVLLETEQLLLEAVRKEKLPAVILRVSGIYGPGRGYYLGQFLRNQAVIAGEGNRILNMVHVEDVAGAILAALEKGPPGEVFNVSDDEPVAELDFFQWLSKTLKKPLPPFLREEEKTSSKRAATNKRVSNEKLRTELQYQFRFPTFREGCLEEITGRG